MLPSKENLYSVKTFILLTGSVLLTGSAVAQSSPIYYGGASDGSAAGRNIPIAQGGAAGPGNTGGTGTAARTITQTGGNGDGTAYIARLPFVALPASGSGGPGDGSDGGRTSQGVVQNQSGGAGDGWTASYTPGVPLPLDMLDFSAARQGGMAALAWTMNRDEEVASYMVERSANAVTFSAIGTVPQTRTANGEYSFNDAAPLTGHNYYRIRSITRHYREALTPVGLVFFEGLRESAQLRLYPNPAADYITVEAPASFLGKNTVLNVYTQSGAVVQSKKFLSTAAASLRISVEDLPAGTYLLQIATDGESTHATFVKR